LNRQVAANFPSGQFASTSYVEIDANDGSILYVKASQEPAIILRSDGRIETIEEGGPLLGAFDPEIFVESMLIGETYFFRESAQLEALIRCASPMLRNRLGAGRPTLSVWSAGCSTGCEPYTIAMLLTELFPAWKIRVLGTDLNRDFLEIARTGEYDARYVRFVPERFLANPLFLKPVGARYRVGDMIREMVSFEPLNLRSDRFPEDQDMILCRNVMIYFEDEMVASMVRGFHRSLASGGHLCVGSADNLSGFDAFFTPLRVAEATVYRRWSTDRREMVAGDPPLKGEKRRERIEIPRIQASRENGAIQIKITGDAGEAAPQFEARLAEAVPSGWTRLVVDLSHLLYISNESLHGLKRFLASGRDVGAEVTIVTPDPRVREYLGQVRFGARTRITVSAAGSAADTVPAAAARLIKSSFPRKREASPGESVGVVRESPPLGAPVFRPAFDDHGAAIRQRRSEDRRSECHPPGNQSPASGPAVAASRERPYRITKQESDGIVIVRCAGDLDAEKSPEIHQELNRAIKPALEARRPRVIIDLAEVAFLDDSHAAIFGRAARLAREHRGVFLVATRSDAVVRLLARQPEPVTVTGAVADAFTILATAGAA
jgi:chemotaxis protein methyltransferase CheR